MNGAHIHLMIVHFPVAGIFFSLLFLFAGLWKKNDAVKLMGLALVLLAGLAAAGAYFTGEGAEHLVKQMPGITMENIHEHEEAAEKSLWVVEAGALLAAFALFSAWKHKTIPDWAFLTVVVLTLLSATALFRVSFLGGQVHHEETRPGFTTSVESH